MSSNIAHPPAGGLIIQKEITVLGSAESAFRRFTEGIAGWWPTATHSVGQNETVAVVFEGREGGRVFELQSDETVVVWGTLTVWDPPHRFAMSWHPGHGDDRATELDVSFEPAPEGARVRLRHSGWEVLGDDAQATCRQYTTGWDPVLARFALTEGETGRVK
jgi:hypothetical protein